VPWRDGAPHGAVHATRLLARCIVGLIAACWVGCAPIGRHGVALREISDGFVRTHFAARPLEAVALGWHEHDGLFVVPTEESIRHELGRLRRYDVLLRDIDERGLRREEVLDLRLLRLAVLQGLWDIETERAWQRNPMHYAGALDVSFYLRRDFKPLRQRVADMAAILGHAPEVFASARANLEAILPRPFVETGIEVARATASFLENDVLRAARSCGDPAVLARFENASAAAVRECRSFAAWLERERLPHATDGFALGRDGYVRMLRA